MLERDHDGDYSLREIIRNFPCDVVFPPGMENYLEEKERLTLDGRRKMARLVFREPAGLEYPEQSMYKRQPGWQRVYMKDISLCGVAFIHSEQLLPQERFRMLIPHPKLLRFGKIRQLIHIKIVRCHRISEKCYDAGAKIINGMEKDLDMLESCHALASSGEDGFA